MQRAMVSIVFLCGLAALRAMGADAVVAPAGGNVAETWESIHLSGQKAGYIHSLTDRVEAQGKAVLHTRFTIVLSTKRFDDPIKMRVDVHSFELPSGLLYAMDSRLDMSGMAQRTRGILDDDNKFQVTVETPGKTQTQSIPWSDDIVGPYAQERAIKDKPMKVGETRSSKTFFPDLNVVGMQTLKAVRKEETELKDGSKRELLVVEETSDKIPITRTLWLDDKGEILKSLMPMGGFTLTGYRVSRAEALGEPLGNNLDLGYQTLVNPDRPLPGVHRGESVTYRLEMADKAAADSIPQEVYQDILGREGNNLTVRVHRVQPDLNAPAGEAPAEFLESNGFLQSDDPMIIQTARAVVGDAKDPWEKAKRLEKWVHDNMTRRDFTIGFATAAEVVATRQGDCTEHAVLLAALCRAVGVPARVAMGLVYIEGDKSFGYHMWTEVFVHGKWYPLDGTIGQGGIAGGHIKLADGSLKGTSAMSTFLPIASMIGKIKIHVDKAD